MNKPQDGSAGMGEGFCEPLKTGNYNTNRRGNFNPVSGNAVSEFGGLHLGRLAGVPIPGAKESSRVRRPVSAYEKGHPPIWYISTFSSSLPELRPRSSE